MKKQDLKAKFRHSIAVRFLGIAIAGLAAVELVFGAFEVYWGYVQQKQDLETKIANHAKFLSSVTPEAIMSFDFLTLERLMEQTAEDPEIVYSVIYNKQGRPLTRFLDQENPIVASHLPYHPQPQKILSEVRREAGLRELRNPIVSEGLLLGEIKLGYSLSNVRSRLVRSTLSRLAGAAVTSFLLASLTVILFDSQVRKPLRDLARLAEALAAGELQQRAVGEEKDEIGQLKGAFNGMASQLQQTMTGLEQQAMKLELLLQELRETQSQLIQAEKMSALGEMVAGIAHEFNNPISFIYGNVEYASEYLGDLLKLVRIYQESVLNIPPELQEEIEDIELDFIVEDFPKIIKSMRTGADRISKLVESLRVFSRLDESELKTVNLHEALDSTIVMQGSRLSSCGIELVKDYGDIPAIECYAAEINQVFLHVLGNAIDALKESLVEEKEDIHRTGKIAIATRQISGERIEIKIRDNGPGIKPEILSKIFNPFFTTKPVGSGTGLGLAISYQIVERHQGQLLCVSTLGEGTEFAIELPICLNNSI
ncbi:MAG: ATP-binding protein [Cyanobacteriota bacterium]|nr:ATP-binding protein [Cyanobacteriota bacterium]